MKLPAVDLENITTLAQAKNVIEQLLSNQTLLLTELQRVQEEMNRLKGQPKKPEFSSSGKQTASVTKLLKEKGHWHKRSKKGGVGIDREEAMDEETTCACGSASFRTLRTRKQIIQGLLFKRDNVMYHGKEKQCLKCGKRYKSRLPKNLQGKSFSPELTSLLSFWKYGCRVTQPLLL